MKKYLLIYTMICFAIILSSCKKDPPSANFEVSKSTVYIGESVSFINKTTDADSYFWDFGDNSTSTDLNPAHSYTTGGPKTIVLTANNKAGTDNYILKVNVYNGRSSYQVKNSTSYSLVLSSYYWDGDEIQDFVIHGTMLSGSISDTTYTSRSKINLGGTMLGVTFIIPTDYSINEHKHNILEINNSTPVYSKSAEMKSGDILINKLDEYLKQ